MATRFEKVYTRDLVESNERLEDLNSEVISKLIKTIIDASNQLDSVTFRIEWAGEYVDFSLDIKGKFIPKEGSIKILNNKNFHRLFDAKSFYEIIKGATKFLIFEGINGLDLSGLQLFSSIKILASKNFEQMLKDLEQAGIVNTETSSNILSVSSKRFRFKRLEEQVKYSTEYYEVDCLGTSFFTYLSDDIEKMWIQLKDGEGEN